MEILAALETLSREQNQMYEMCIHPKQGFDTLKQYIAYMRKGGDNDACKEENNGSTEGSEKDDAQ